MKFILSEDAQKQLNKMMERKGVDTDCDDVIIVELTSYGKYDDSGMMSGPTYIGDKVSDPEVNVTTHICFSFNAGPDYGKDD